MLSLTNVAIESLILITTTLTITAIDYENNDLAKVCRPLDRQMDLLFVLDGSGSVSGSTFATQMAMLNKIVDMIEIGPKNTQIAVMQYSSYTRVEFNFSANPVGCCFKNKETLRASLQKIRHISGTTKTGKALDKALHIFRHDSNSGARLNEDDVAQVAVVVTDGHSHDDPIPAALRLRQAGVQILTLGIGAHINMGELVEITGDENLAFQNLTSQASLDQFLHQFKKIAIGEHCDFSRGPLGAEITCHSDSVEIVVSTVNPFHGHLYVASQFHHPECTATAQNSSSKEIRLSIDLNSCNIQRQMKQNLMGTLFETNVILKFHPLYNTRADKVFKVQCFYPEKAPKLPRKYVDNRVAISDKNELEMPCSYKIVSNSKSNDKCRLEDARVGDQIIHSWDCDKDSFDIYQSMLVHSCVIIDLISGVNRTIIDSNGCAIDNSVIDAPKYVESLSAFAIGKAVKFPDGPIIKMQCHLRFCDRLLGECDAILPPRCRRNRRAAERSDEDISTTSSKEMNRSWDFADSTDDTDDDDDEYEDDTEEAATISIITTIETTTTTIKSTTTTSSAAPLLTFHPTQSEKIKSRRRLTIVDRITASASHSVRSFPILLASSSLGETPPREKLIGDEEASLIASPMQTKTNRLELKERQQKVKSLRKNVSKTPRTTTVSSVLFEKTTTSAPIFNKAVKGADGILPHQLNHNIFRTSEIEFSEIAKQPINHPIRIESEESIEELVEDRRRALVPLEQRIRETLRSDAMIVESQVINVRDLAVMSDPNLKEKLCR
uniref:ZP domain-containing protein n=1 Tax=Elaeophora elaphi TaxID=1147741 RepID=A0A0R3RJ32_9BILA